MKIEIKKTDNDTYYTLSLDNKMLEGLYDEKELIRALIGIVRSCFNITDNKLKKEESLYY